MTGFIYKYENKINHKVYIGQTTDLVNRKSSHRYKAAFIVNKFYNVVRKYGWDSFDYDIVAQIEADTYEEVTQLLDSLERDFIEKYDSFHNGYNSTIGGHSYRGKTVSEDFKEYCRNRTYSEETREKMRIAAQNKVVSEETKEKCRQNALKRGLSNLRLLNIKGRIEGIRKALGRTVLQIDTEGNVVNEFQTVKDAAKYVASHYALDRKPSGIETGIRRHCKNKIKKGVYYGFEWKFKTNV